MDTATWTAGSYGDDIVTIYPRPLDPRACESPCRYYIGVFAALGSDANYRVIATLGDQDPIVLRPGAPVTSHLARHEESLYQLTLPRYPEYTYVDINLSPSVGDSDLYVSFNGARPGPDNWQYKSTAFSSDDYVKIHTYDWPW